MKHDARFLKQRRIVAQSVVRVVVIICTRVAVVGIMVENAALIIVRTLSIQPATVVRLCPCASAITVEIVMTRVMHRR